MDAKRITNFITKTTSEPLTQNSQQAPANLQNSYRFDHDPKLADTMSYLTFVQH